jgi:PKHD-type hydroxylase
MLVNVTGVLDRQRLRLVQELLARAPFVDGRLSAGAMADRVKRNEEVDVRTQEITRLNDVVMRALVAHPTYQAAAMPLRVAAPYYARYRPGMTYGDHIDDPIMQADMPYRSDIAITVFLNDPDDYEGGELVVRGTFGDQRVKLPAGDAVLYPASSVHQVAPVTRGERLVAVTWLQSAIRDPAKREILYGLYLAKEALRERDPEARETVQVNHAYVNLVRMWAEI